MKKIKYLIISLSMLSLVACNDFFETSTSSAVGDEIVFSDPGNIQEVIGNIYSQFYADKSYRNRLACGYQGMNTDIEYNTKSGSADRDQSRYSMQLTNSSLSQSSGKDPWGYLNKAVESSNLVIAGISTYADLNDPEVKYLLGEAYTLRAFVYLELIKIWGDVPAHFSPINTSDLNDVFSPKVDRNIIYEQLRTDLKTASELMGWSEEIAWATAKNSITRPNKAFALGLLSRVDMMYAGKALRPNSIDPSGTSPYSVQFNVTDVDKRKELYQEALDACGEVIEHYGDTKLKSSFIGVFKDLCEDKVLFPSTEWLWVMPFANGTRGQFMNYNCPKSSEAWKALKNNQAGSTNSVQAIVPTFIYDMDANDARKWVTIAPFSWAADNADGISSTDSIREIVFPGTPAADKRLYQKNVNITGVYLGKYRVEWMTRTRTGGDDGIDYPVMRYADILLMYAEASLGSLNGDIPARTSYNGISAQAQFDKIRTRANMPTLPLNMTNIMQERAFEFCGEYIRKYDLMRWGNFYDKLVETTARLQDLDNHTGDYANTSDTLFFNFKEAPEMLYTGADPIVKKAYVFDTVWGLNKGEDSAPVGFDKNAGWISKDMFFSGVLPRYLDNNYKLYADQNTLESRQYWPIFGVNVANSNGSLWNDYGY